MSNTKQRVLVGNSYPLSLVRGGEVRMTCLAVEELRAIASESEVVSFWGHENTRAVAEGVLGKSLRPSVARPALSVSPEGRPMLDGETFDACWVLSPDYVPGYRPAIGTEVGAESITGWSVVKLEWI